MEQPTTNPYLRFIPKYETSHLDGGPSVAAVAAKLYALQHHYVSEAYTAASWRSLEMYILPLIGSMPIDQVSAHMVIELLRPLETSGKLVTVQRLCQRINAIFDYSVNFGLIDANPCSAIREEFQKPTKKSMPTITPDELSLLMTDIAAGRLDQTIRCQIEWNLHTLVRPGESAGTRWDEIDLENKIWIIPSDKMRKNRSHRVPLTPQTIALLERMKPISGHQPYVFPSYRNPHTHISNRSTSTALKQLGYGGRLVAQGLRSLGCNILLNQGFAFHVIEAALAHINESKIRFAFNRSDYFEQRVTMMSWWSNHIVQASQGNQSLASGTKALKLVNE